MDFIFNLNVVQCFGTTKLNNKFRTVTNNIEIII